MNELFCVVCQRQEFAILPSGKTVKKTSDATDILCSICTQHCTGQGFQKPPWGGKEEIQLILKQKSERQLKKRNRR